MPEGSLGEMMDRFDQLYAFCKQNDIWKVKEQHEGICQVNVV